MRLAGRRAGSRRGAVGCRVCCCQTATSRPSSTPDASALEPFDAAMVQPSSIDVRLDRFFRTFENHRYPHIDPAEDQPDLTRMVEPEGDEPFILHPGEFVLGSTYEVVTLPDDVAARLEGKSSLGPARPAHPLHRRLHRPGLLRPRHARAGQRREPADQAVAGDEDRPAVLLPAVARRPSIPTARRSTARATRGSAARPRRGRSRASTARRSTDRSLQVVGEPVQARAAITARVVRRRGPPPRRARRATCSRWVLRSSA